MVPKPFAAPSIPAAVPAAPVAPAVAVAPAAVPAAPAPAAPASPAPAPVPQVVAGKPSVPGAPPVALPAEPAAEQGQEADADASGEEADAQPAVPSISLAKPSGAPDAVLVFIAWSRMPLQRLVSMRIGTGPLNVLHEGEYVEGLQVTTIHKDSVDFTWSSQKYRVPVKAF